MNLSRHTLCKEERLHGKKDIERLLAKGKFSDTGKGIRFCYIRNDEVQTDENQCLNRIMVSVPKKNFKRAVKRNLLKRRLRESYRLQKDKLNGKGYDILFIYGSKEVMPFQEIYDIVESIIDKVNNFRMTR